MYLIFKLRNKSPVFCVSAVEMLVFLDFWSIPVCSRSGIEWKDLGRVRVERWSLRQALDLLQSWFSDLWSGGPVILSQAPRKLYVVRILGNSIWEGSRWTVVVFRCKAYHSFLVFLSCCYWLGQYPPPVAGVVMVTHQALANPMAAQDWNVHLGPLVHRLTLGSQMLQSSCHLFEDGERRNISVQQGHRSWTSPGTNATSGLDSR